MRGQFVLMMKTNILSWNARGLKSQGRRWRVKEICKQNKVSIMYVQETKSQRGGWEAAQDMWGKRTWGFMFKEAIS